MGKLYSVTDYKETPKERTNRLSLSLKHRFQRILEEAKAYEKFKQLLIKTNKPEIFLKAFELAHDRAFGKAQQYIDMEINGTVSPVPNEVLEEIAAGNSYPSLTMEKPE